MPTLPPFQPDKKSPLWKSERKEELLDIFAHGVRDIAEGRVDDDYVVSQLLDADPSLKESRTRKDVNDALKKFEQVTKLTTGISPEEVNLILSDDTKRAENIAGIRRGVAGVFFKMVKNILEDPEALADMDPSSAAKWYELVRKEEDRERELMLKAKAEAREDAKFKLMFFDFISGKLGAEDIEFLNNDLKNDLTKLLDANPGGASRRILEGAAIASPSTGAQ